MTDLRVGMGVSDLCRACKDERRHTVTAVDPRAQVVRVLCDTCGSQHNYRGGGSRASTTPSPKSVSVSTSYEKRMSPMNTPTDVDASDLELLLRRVLREESGLTPVPLAKKWRGGEIVLKPAAEGQQDKSIPIETLFHKVVMVRNRLRTLEQQVNSADLPQDLKVKLQGYVTGCYGSLTTFNVLFAEEDDKFKGSSKPK